MHWEVITEVYAHKTKDILPVSNSPNQVWYKELHGLIGANLHLSFYLVETNHMYQINLM